MLGRPDEWPAETGPASYWRGFLLPQQSQLLPAFRRRPRPSQPPPAALSCPPRALYQAPSASYHPPRASHPAPSVSAAHSLASQAPPTASHLPPTTSQAQTLAPHYKPCAAAQTLARSTNPLCAPTAEIKAQPRPHPGLAQGWPQFSSPQGCITVGPQ
jgi:hypothetical protein